MKSDIKGNAQRIAYTLKDISTVPNKVKAIAQLLNYDPEQLQEDMNAVCEYIQMLEKQIDEK